MVLYSRRKRKLQWRKSMVERKSGWDEVRKRKITEALELSYMSSEEEVVSDDEQIFIVKPLPWRSEEYNKYMEDLDSKYERNQSSRSKRQMIKRVKGDIPSIRPKPTHVKEGHEWVVN
ncbi:uncharacterized protein LOC134278119 [Saccostrea cucullata]|uniref:uncharacterized protein LOC134278119 n=1 Tax=Saccostrea cuccullata TaxID=36930 RepID=UPI002ECFD44E